jgi:5-methylcytosine-specific restriction endonuclease McrA
VAGPAEEVPTVEESKRCARCKQEKPRSEFPAGAKWSDGLFPYCRECKRASQREDHARHKAARNAYGREQYRRDPESYKARAKARYAADPERGRADAKRWREANPERHGELQRRSARRRYEENPEPRRESWRRRKALKLTRTVHRITPAMLAAKAAYWGDRCWMCGGPFEAWDHVKPLGKGGLHVLANLRPACKSCNSRKHDQWPYRRPA